MQWWGQYSSPWSEFHFTEIEWQDGVPAALASGGLPAWLIAGLAILGVGAAAGGGGGGGGGGFILPPIPTPNQAPTGDAQPVSARPGESVAGRVLGRDADGDTLSFMIGTPPAHGSVTMDPATGAFVYVPAAGYQGADSFTVIISDGKGGTATVTVPVTVAPLVENSPPLAEAEPLASNGGASAQGKVDASDPDGDSLTYTVSQPPAHGTVTLDPNTGEYVYTPEPGYGGPDEFEVTVDDGNGGTTTVTVGVTVTPGPIDGPAAPTVTISTDANNDGWLNSDELGTSTTVAVHVTAPTGTKVGDTLSISINGGTPVNVPVTQAILDNGYTTSVPRPADGASLTVSATLSDPLGNVSLPGSDSAKVDATVPAAPVVTITTDANDDGLLNGAELGASSTVDVRVTVPAGAQVGDTLQVSINGGNPVTVPVTQAILDNGYSTTAPRPANGASVTVSATLTDPAGNVSLPGSDSATVDGAASSAPAVEITTDVNDDGWLNSTELGTTTTVGVRVTVPPGTQLGDTLQVSVNGGTPVAVPVTQAILDNGYSISVPRPADGGSLTVSATLTDLAGNVSPPGSDSARVDATLPAAPTVTITTDGNNDGVLSTAELGSATTVAVRITVPAGAQVGDTLQVSINGGAPVGVPVTQAILDNGYSTTAPRPANGAGVTVSATLSDPAGNVSAPASDSATVNTTALPAPTVQITTDGNNDGWLNDTELGAAVTVDVLVTVPAGTQVGDTLRVSIDGGAPVVVPVTQAILDNGYSTTAPRPADGAQLTVSATVQNPVGNVSAPGSDSATVDTTPPAAPTVQIASDANNDGVLNSTELGAGTTVDVLVTVPAGTQVGDTLHVSIDGGAPVDVPVTQAILDNGYSTTAPRPANGAGVTVSATLSDPAGNESAPASDNATVDTTLPAAPTVEITTDGNDDGVLNSTELGAATTVDVLVTVPAGAQVGDILHVSIDGGAPVDVPVTQAILDDGYSMTAPRPTDGAAVTVSATLENAVGNVSVPASDSATVDTTLPAAPTVEITTDANDDGVLNSTELGAGTTVDVLVTVPAGTQVGDTLRVSIDGGAPVDVPVTQAILDDGYSTTAPRPANGAGVTVSATVENEVGNVSAPGSDSATVDTTPPASPTVEIITDSDDDGWLNISELGAGTTVDVLVTVPAGTQVGDTLRVSIDGGAPVEVPVTQAILDDGYSTVAPRPADGAGVTVSATLENAVGNVSAPASDSATVDTTPPAAPTVEITTDANDDGVLNSPELGAGTTVDVLVTVPAGTQVGDTLHVSIDGGAPVDVPVTQAILDNGYSTTAPRPANGAGVTVSATLSDPAGNESAPASDNATVDTTLPAAPTVEITTDGNDDGVLNSTELGAATTVDVLVTVPAGAQVGDILHVSIDGGAPVDVPVTQAILDDGYSMTAPRPTDGAGVTVSATVENEVGNVSAPGSDSATVDTTPPAAPTVEITSDANDDGVLNSTELGAATTVDVLVTVPAGAQVGDTLRVSIDGGAPVDVPVTQAILDDGYSMTVPRPADGAGVTVSATLENVAGNVSAPASDSATVDTTLPAAPTVEITTDADDDGVLNGPELGAGTTVDVLVTVPTGTQVGDILHVSIDGGTPVDVPVTQAILDDGYSTTAPRPANGAAVTVSATVENVVGNVSVPASDSATVNTTALPAPTVEITTDSDDDGWLNTSELGAVTTVDVLVTVPVGTQVGDTLRVSIDGGAPVEVPVTQAILDDGYSTTAPRPDDGSGVTVSATVENALGNVSTPGSDSATVDTTPPAAPTVEITSDANDDGVLNSTELGAGTTVDVLVTVPVGAQIGDTLHVSIDGGVPVDVPVTQAILDDGYSMTAPRPADGSGVTVSATLSDPAGNESVPASDSATVDTTAPAAPLVQITTDSNDDGLLSSTELGSATTVAVLITVPAGTQVGDTLLVRINNSPTAIGYLVSQTILDNGLTVSAPRPAEGSSVTVTATLSDPAGNVSAPASDSAMTDTTPPLVLAAQQFAYTENQVAGARVATVAAIGDATGWRFANGSQTSTNGYYQINNDGEITITAAGAAAGVANNDFETGPNNFTESVQARDAAGNWSTATNVGLQLLNANEVPVLAFTFVESSLSPGSATLSQVVAIANSSDPDMGDTRTYALTPGSVAASSGYYEIDTDGLVTLTQAGVNFINGGGTPPIVDVTVTDAGGLSARETVLIGTGDGTPPVVTADQVYSYAENQVEGAALATLTATDAMGVTGWRFSNGSQTSANGYYQIDNSGVIRITAAGAAAGVPTNDYEIGANTFALSVQARDAAGNWSPATNVTLNLIDVNDAPVAVPDRYNLSQAASLGGLYSEYYGYAENVAQGRPNLSTLTLARQYIQGRTPDATFVATKLEYGFISGNLGKSGGLAQFVKATDAASINNGGTPIPVTSDAVIRFTGYVNMDAGDYRFRVLADDGYSIYVNGVNVAEVSVIQGATEREHDLFSVGSSGLQHIEIFYWDQSGGAQFNLRVAKADINGVVDQASYVFVGTSTYTLSAPPSNSHLVVDSGKSLIIPFAELIDNDTDQDGDHLTIIAVSNASNGTVELTQAGNVVFHADAGYFGEATFDYTVSDGHGGTATTTVTLYVQPANVIPQASSLAFSDAPEPSEALGLQSLEDLQAESDKASEDPAILPSWNELLQAQAPTSSTWLPAGEAPAPTGAEQPDAVAHTAPSLNPLDDELNQSMLSLV